MSNFDKTLELIEYIDKQEGSDFSGLMTCAGQLIDEVLERYPHYNKKGLVNKFIHQKKQLESTQRSKRIKGARVEIAPKKEMMLVCSPCKLVYFLNDATIKANDGKCHVCKRKMVYKPFTVKHNKDHIRVTLGEKK